MIFFFNWRENVQIIVSEYANFTYKFVMTFERKKQLKKERKRERKEEKGKREGMVNEFDWTEVNPIINFWKPWLHFGCTNISS